MPKNDNMSFWTHLDVLRKVFLRCAAVWLVAAVVAFCFKQQLFDVIFAPSTNDFVLYRLMRDLSVAWGIESLYPADFKALFINTELAAQFITHMKMAAWAGVVVTMPYIVFELYRFVEPALYKNEKKHSISALVFGTLLFVCGVLLNYFVIFPFSFRFLSTYQVSAEVVNQISLSSYISSFLLLSLLMGVMFEIPLLGMFLAKMGLINAPQLRHYRRHAFVVILVIAAVITPTGDAITLMLVSLPIYLLYELTILIVKKKGVKNGVKEGVIEGS